jgi:hypothetical protein
MKKILESIIFFICSIYLFAQVPSQTYTWKSVTINGGGYVPGFVFNKAGNNLLYARTDVGGAYRWNHANKSWIPLSDFVTSGNQLGVISIAADANDSNRVYMATGLYTNSWDPTGVLYSSTNRGDSWTRIEVPFKVGGNEQNRGSGERLQVDPNTSNVLYFGSQKEGLFKSLDYGVTWTKVSTFPKLNCTFVQIDPGSGIKGSSSKDIYVGTYDNFIAADTTKGGLYKSIDGGLTWAYWTGQPEKVEPKSYDNPKISTPAVPNNLGFAGDNIFITMGNNLAPSTNNGYVVKYNKTSKIWTKIYPVGHDSQGGYNGLAIHPTNPNIIYVGTLGHWWPTADIIYVTTNGGVTWNDVSQKMKTDLKNTPHGGGMGWLSGLTINPNNPNHAVFGSGNGLTMTYDLTKSITNDSTHWVYENDNFEETVPLDLASPPSGSQLISGLGDIHGFVHLDLTKSPANNFNGGGNTYSIDFAETNPQIIVRTHDGGKRASITKNNGVTWTEFTTQASGGNTSVNYITISPDAATIIWSPSNAIPSYSNDGGVTWTLCAGLGSGVAPQSDRVNSTIFYAIDNSNSSFLKSIDRGKTFSKTTATFSFTGGMSIKPVFGKEGHVWISANDNGLYFSNNGGAALTKITSVSAAYKVTFGKAAPNANYPTVFIFGKINDIVGLYRSDDMAATWIKINNKDQQFGRGYGCIAGDPKTYGRLFISTGGRGILYGDTPASTICYAPSLGESLSLCKTSRTKLSTNITASGYTYEWSLNGMKLDSIGSAIIIFKPGDYSVIANKTGCPSAKDYITVTSRFIEINDATICKGSTATLSPVKISNYSWLNANYIAFDTAQSIQASPTANTQFYVKDITIKSFSIGIPAYTSGGWGLGNAFDNNQNIANLIISDNTRIKGISMYVNSAGTKGVIRIVDSNGNVVVSSTKANLATGMLELPFDFLLTSGTYTIDAVGTIGSVQFQSDRTNAVFSIPNYVTYTPKTGWAYGIFFNLRFETENTCAPTPVSVTVTNLLIATITAGTATTFCTGGNVVLTTSTGSSYKWFNGTTQVGTAATYTASVAGSYTVEVTNANGCKASSAPQIITVTTSIVWYQDADGDGKGDASSTLTSWTQPTGYVSIAGDTCPLDPNKFAPGICGCGNTETSCLDCAGTPNGTAFLDNCSICVGGTTGNRACVSTVTVNGTISDIKVMPQPFDLTTTIRLENQGNIQSITIFNASGALVQTVHNLNTQEITLGDELAAGLYTVIVQTDYGIYNTKIMKK